MDRVCGQSRVFSDREPNYVWSERMWTWAAVGVATHFLTLQDDAIVAPGFWGHLETLIALFPDQVIGLEAAYRGGESILTSWYTTPDMLIGVGYVVPIPLLREFLVWRCTLRKGAIESVTEDTLLAVWCLASGHRIFHPVPTIIDHDTEIASSYGNDHHSYRRPSVTWKDRSPGQWRIDYCRLPRFYAGTPRLARRWIVGATEEDFQQWLAT